MSIISKFFSDPSEKVIKIMQTKVDEINALEEKFKKISNEELKEMTHKFKEQISENGKEIEIINEILNKILPEAFAVVREASVRVLGQRQYDVQLIGDGQFCTTKSDHQRIACASLSLQSI